MIKLVVSLFVCFSVAAAKPSLTHGEALLPYTGVVAAAVVPSAVSYQTRTDVFNNPIVASVEGTSFLEAHVSKKENVDVADKVESVVTRDEKTAAVDDGVEIEAAVAPEGSKTSPIAPNLDVVQDSTLAGGIISTQFASVPAVATLIQPAQVVKTTILGAPVIKSTVLEAPVIKSAILEAPAVKSSIVEVPVQKATPLIPSVAVQAPIVSAPVVKTIASPQFFNTGLKTVQPLVGYSSEALIAKAPLVEGPSFIAPVLQYGNFYSPVGVKAAFVQPAVAYSAGINIPTGISTTEVRSNGLYTDTRANVGW